MNASIDEKKLAVWLGEVPAVDARVQVFAFPYAGGSPSVFRGWQDLPGHNLQLVPIALPGREKRMGEPFPESVASIAGELAEAVLAHARPPYILLGLCFGACVAFEVGRIAERAGLPPAGLVVAGSRAPHTPPPVPVDGLSKDEFIRILHDLRFIPDEIFALPELLEMFLPQLRADFLMDERYRCADALPCCSFPVQVMFGKRDTITPREQGRAWSECTSAVCGYREYPGDQLFFAAFAEQFLAETDRFARMWTSPAEGMGDGS